MKKLYGRLGISGSILFLLFGCATSERRIARQIDLTPSIIKQSSELLKADRELGRFPIVVDGFKGDMRLKGHVDTAGQKLRAEKIVWAAQGVKSVENDLKISGNPARP